MSAHDQSQEVRRLNFAPDSHSLSLILPLSLYTVILRALPTRRERIFQTSSWQTFRSSQSGI